ncbi:MAG: lipopolysaccharide biosynthesis protein [Pirellulales bacterium]
MSVAPSEELRVASVLPSAVRRAWRLRKTSGQAALALVDQGVVSGASFLACVCVGRWAGNNELGLYALAFSLVVLLACALESLVMTPYLVLAGRTPGVEQARYAGSIFVHLLVLAAISMVLLAVAAIGVSAFGSQEFAVLLALLVPIVPFTLLREFARRFAYSQLNLRVALALDMCVTMLQIGTLLVLARAEMLSAATALVALGASSGIVGIAWLVVACRSWTIRRADFWPSVEKNWRFGRWVFLALMALMLQANVVPWLLAGKLGPAATGIFAACLTIVQFANPLIQGISNWLVPAAARAFESAGITGVRSVVNRSTALLCTVIGALAAVVIVFGDRLASLLYDRDFTQYRTLLMLLGVAMLARAWGMAAYNGLIAIERPQSNLAVNLLGLLVTFVAAPVGLALGGLTGAVCGLFAGDVASAICRWLAFWTESGRLATAGIPAGRHEESVLSTSI